MVTDDARTRRLRELAEKWQMRADALYALMRKSEHPEADAWAMCASDVLAVLDTEGDRPDDVELEPAPIIGGRNPRPVAIHVTDTEGDASPAPPEGIAHEWRFDTIIGHYRCNRCFARDDGSHGPTCPKATLPDPPVQP
jgi:hypothetical protein